MECFLVGLRGAWGNHRLCGGRLIPKAYSEGSLETTGHMMWEVHGIGRCARSTGTVLSVKRKSVTASSVEGSSRFLCCTEMSDPPHRRQTMRCVWQVRLRTSERADICEIWLLRNHLITARQVSVAGGQRLK
ncbi:uncharacterized protein [Physcomitrium patens]|uniref:uncharacterized protein n=1 Tax=Physcomitrium patens TaxID=3218 RepID=UPI000D167E94|nr:uncharacterized protein LOC112277709 [Physcomitrium patens]|eukprot:XP_024366109.1 uncharacterized protein LOC112277709 [Physcomitrella patens]